MVYLGSTVAMDMAGLANGSAVSVSAPTHMHTSCGMSQAVLVPNLPPAVSMGVPVMWTSTDVDVNSVNSLSPPMTTMPMTYHSMEHLMAQHSCSPQHYSGGSTSTVFFAGVTPVVPTETLLSVFAQFGRVMDLNLFRPYKGCRTSKGCGLVVFAQQSEAAAALETLNGRFVWPGARTPMVIEWCDPSKQHKRKRAQPLTPSVLQQVLAFQPHSMPCMPGLMPATSFNMGFNPMMADGNAGRLMMQGY